MAGQGIHIISFTAAGALLAERLRESLAERLRGTGAEEIETTSGRGGTSLSAWTKERFRTGHTLIFIGACGIAVRAIAPYVGDKTTDPAVVVLDEKGEYVIPLLSGHAGDANRKAKGIAALTGGTAVLTTATEVNRLFAVDVFARDNGLRISDREQAKLFSARLLETGRAALVIPEPWQDIIRVEGALPKELSLTGSAPRQTPFCLISPAAAEGGVLQLTPGCLIVGIGCRQGKSAEALTAFLQEVLREGGLSEAAVERFVSIDLKREERGILLTAKRYGARFETFSAAALQAVRGEFQASAFVRKKTGTDNVCERAVMAAGAAGLLIGKKAKDGMTIAVGVRETVLRIASE